MEQKKEKCDDGMDLRENSAGQSVPLNPFFMLQHSESEDDEDAKNRTPSGNIITQKASDIRAFFSPKATADENKNQGKQIGLKSHRDSQVKANSASNCDVLSQPCLFDRDQHDLQSASAKVSGAEKGQQTLTADSIQRHVNANLENKENLDRRIKEKARRLKRKRASGGSGGSGLPQPNKKTNEGETTEDEKTSQDLNSTINTTATSEMDFEVENKLQAKIVNALAKQDNTPSIQECEFDKTTESEESASLLSTEQVIEGSNIEDQNDQEDNMDDNPQSLSLTSIYHMFLDLKKQIAGNSKVNSNLKETCIEESSKAANEIVQHETMEVKQLKYELASYKHKTEILTDIVHRMHIEQEDLIARVENLEMSGSKKSIAISGMTIEGKKDQMMEAVYNFIEDTFGIQVEIEDVYKIGQYEPKLIVVALQNMKDKMYIMKNKGVLKDQKIAGRAVFINDFMPLSVQEKKRREKQIIQEAEEKNPEVSIKYNSGRVVIQGTPYVKRVRPPTPKELINVPIEDLDRILKIDLPRGPQITQDNSKFVAYSAAVKDFKDIRELYIRMKLIQPNARHIPCAYIIPGEQTQFSQDFHDDGEHGAGRVLLDMMQRNTLQNRVIFVARRYGGVRMGASRFECYAEAAKGVVQGESF